MRRILRGLTQNRAETDPASRDYRLRGRTYAIPFQDVWTAALALTDGGMEGWSVVHADDHAGVIEAVSTTSVFRSVDDVHVEIGLDRNGQTRVDVCSSSRVGRMDLGRNPRTIGAFLECLDRSLDVSPGQILDPTLPTSWETHA